MDDNIMLEEVNLVQDIEHALAVYVPDDLDLEELNNGLNEVESLGQNFRRVHAKLKLDLKDKYDFPNADGLLEKMSNFVKSAKKKQITLEKEKYYEDLKIRFDFLENKINLMRSGYDVASLTSLLELDEFLVKSQELLDEFCEVFSNLKRVAPSQEYNDVYTPKFDTLSKNLSEDVKLVRVSRSKVAGEQVSIPTTLPTTLSHQPVVSVSNVGNTVLKAQNLSQEIVLRCQNLSSKLDQKLDSLGDYQILEISQNLNFDVEFNRILEKITELSSLADEGESNLPDIEKWRDTLSAKREKFVNSLQDIVASRDITPDKLKNACTIQIDVPKFSGYDSKIDYFSFKSKFQKLVEPRVQKPYLADYLKLNYLDGLAFTLVEKGAEYEKIWERLKESYGNARLLLHNKLGELDKIGGLWKIRGDTKMAEALAGIINIMKELRVLASEHGL